MGFINYDSMAMQQDLIDWRYLSYIRPVFQAYVREYPQKMWPYMVEYLHFRFLKWPVIGWMMTRGFTPILGNFHVSQEYQQQYVRISDWMNRGVEIPFHPRCSATGSTTITWSMGAMEASDR